MRKTLVVFSLLFAASIFFSEKIILKETLLVDDFENPSNNNFVSGWSFIYSDRSQGNNTGLSTVKPNPSDKFLVKSSDGYNNSRCLFISGNAVPSSKITNPYIGLGIYITNFFRTHSYDGISFMARSSFNKPFSVRLERPDEEEIPTKPYYQQVIYPSTNWEYYEIYFSQFSPPFYNTNKLKPLDTRQVEKITFQSVVEGSNSLFLDDIKFFRVSNINSEVLPSKLPNKDFRSGIVFTGYYYSVYDENMKTVEQAIDLFSNTTIGVLYTFYFYRNNNVSRIPGNTPDILSVNRVFKYASEKGNSTALYLYIDPVETNSWRGNNFINLDDYRQLLETDLRGLSTKPDFIVLSSGMNAAETTQEQSWESLILAIRRILPKSMICYSLDRNSTIFQGINRIPDYFKMLDYIGVNPYYEGVTADSVAYKVEQSLKRLKAINLQTGTKPFIAEIGWPSASPIALSQPWMTPDPKTASENQDLQYDLYKAVLPLVRKEGVPFMIWRIEPNNFSLRTDYTPMGKKSESYIKGFLTLNNQTSPSVIINSKPLLFKTDQCWGVFKVNGKDFNPALYHCSSINYINGQIRKTNFSVTNNIQRMIVDGEGFSAAEHTDNPRYGSFKVQCVNGSGVTDEIAALPMYYTGTNFSFTNNSIISNGSFIILQLEPSDWGTVMRKIEIYQ